MGCTCSDFLVGQQYIMVAVGSAHKQVLKVQPHLLTAKRLMPSDGSWSNTLEKSLRAAKMVRVNKQRKKQ